MNFNSWRLILAVYLFGVCGTSSVALIVPLASDFRALYGLEPASFGWLVSIVALPALLVALASALIIERYGAARTLIGAACVVAACDLGHMLAGSLPAVFALRVIEGSAIIQFYTAGPTLLMAATEEPRRTRAMTFWATYMPVGTAIGLAAGGLFAGLPFWRGIFLAHGVLTLAAALIGTRLPRDTSAQGPGISLASQLSGLRSAYCNPRIVALSLAFFMLIAAGFGANLALPLYLARTQDVSMAVTSATIAIATLAMFPGSILAGAALTRFGMSGVFLTTLALVGITAGTGAFVTGLAAPLEHAILFVWFLAAGAGTATALAMLPRITAPTERGAAAAVLNQAAALAVIVSPPLWLKLAATGGWRDFGLLMTVAWIAAALLLARVGNRVDAARTA